MDSFIEIKNVKKFFRSSSNKEPVKALNGIDLSIGRGDIVGIIGESGSGKTTLGKVLVGLEDLTDGEILFDGRNHSDLLKEDRVGYYRNTQMIFQNPYDVFDNYHSIYKLFWDVFKIHKIGTDDMDKKEIMISLLEKGSLKPGEDFLRRFPYELSGGQLQRIAILRSMVLEPKMLVADEPVTMLDVSVRSEIINLLTQMQRNLDTSIIFISHDISTTSYISQRICVMYLGQIVEEGPTEEIITNPRHPYTIALISNTSSIFEGNRGEPIKLVGDPSNPVGLGDICYFCNRCYKARDRCFKEMPELQEITNGRKVRCFYYDK